MGAPRGSTINAEIFTRTCRHSNNVFAFLGFDSYKILFFVETATFNF